MSASFLRLRRFDRPPPINNRFTCSRFRFSVTTPRLLSSSSSSGAAEAEPPFDPAAYLAAARHKFASAPPTLTRDVLSPTPSRLLTLSLADHCPSLFPDAATLSSSSSAFHSASPPHSSPDTTTTTTITTINHHHHHHPGDGNDNGNGNGNGGNHEAPVLPQGHHLVYFPLQLPPSQLMPDGTDPAHWPGAPFVRRMWAGGEVVFAAPRWQADLRLDGRRAVGCVERVDPASVVMKGGAAGGAGGEKVFVEVRRAYGLLLPGRDGDPAGGVATPVVEEVRRLVFLRRRGGGGPEGEGEGEAEAGRRGKGVKVPYTAEFTYPLKPDATLLFHFSALTYNAHAIHLDREYARDVEGYRGLLVHGPLTLALMLAALRASLMQLRLRLRGGPPQQHAAAAAAAVTMPYVKSIRYSNLAPLYADEEMRVCLRRNRQEGGDELGWDVWVEGPEGGLAVKATAITTAVM